MWEVTSYTKVMVASIHKNARTTPAVREEIKNSKETIYALAKKYNLSWNTVRKWKQSSSTTDKSSRPNKIRSSLTLEQEDRICFERKQYKKTVDDVYTSLSDEIPDLYPMKVYRCLKRHGLETLPSEFIAEERRIQKFKNYGIGYIHIDLLYAPKINKQRKYVYTAIDRVCKVAYIAFSSRKTKESGAIFLNNVIRFFDYKINYILTDNGPEFCYKALPKSKRTKKIHPFDKICQERRISHRTTKFYHPWTNGMVERFNRKIKDNVFRKHQFQSIFDLEQRTLEFVDRYNHQIRLKSLDYKTPQKFLEDRKGVIIQRIVI